MSASLTAPSSAESASPSVIWFEDLTRRDVALVGGKNASLGEMVRTLSDQGVSVPPGFATTADAYRRYLDENRLNQRIDETTAALEAGKLTLAEAGRTIRATILAGDWPVDIAAAILDSYRALGRRRGTADLPVAVRSSATAEDLPDASFAGQQETFLNVRGEAALLDACRRCYASLFTDRAITYRRLKGEDRGPSLEDAEGEGIRYVLRAAGDRPGDATAPEGETHLLLEIPPRFQELKARDASLARAWRDAARAWPRARGRSR